MNRCSGNEEPSVGDEAFTHDVFLSHSAKDKAVVRAVAERLRSDGLRVWLDDWEIRPQIHSHFAPRNSDFQRGLAHSRMLACPAEAPARRRMLCMSANAFGSDWAQLEAGTFRFRYPLNKERRFIPLRLDDAPIKGSRAQFLYINWRPADRDQEYPKLLEACRQQRSRPHAGARCLDETAGTETRRPRRSKRRQSTQGWSESGVTFQARRTGDSWLAGPSKPWRRLCWLSHGDETTLRVAEKCV
jgi:hypothetical protein